MPSEDDEAVLRAARSLAARGISAFAVLNGAVAAEDDLAAYARKKGLALSPDGRAILDDSHLAGAIRNVESALFAPTLVRRVSLLRYLVANPSEQLSSSLRGDGLSVYYKVALPDLPDLPHLKRDGSTFYSETRKTKEASERDRERNLLEDTPIGARTTEATVDPPPPSDTAHRGPMLKVLRGIASAIARPRRNFSLLHDAKLQAAISLNDQRRILMAERALTETESWVALAAQREMGETADSLRKFVQRMFSLASHRPQRFNMGYRKGPINPEFLAAFDAAERRGLIPRLIEILRNRAISLQ